MNYPNLILPEFEAAKAKLVTATVEGILELDDLRVLAGDETASKGADTFTPGVPAPRPAALEPAEPKLLKRIKEKHHSVARLIASGVSQRLVAHISGYNEQYLSVLLNNPAMEELISLYRMQFGKSAEVITEKLRTIGTQALERLEQRMPELGDNELIQVAKLGMDRSGHGPTSTQNINETKLLVDAAELTRLNQEARRRSDDYIIPVREVRGALSPPKAEEPEDGGA